MLHNQFAMKHGYHIRNNYWMNHIHNIVWKRHTCTFVHKNMTFVQNQVWSRYLGFGEDYIYNYFRRRLAKVYALSTDSSDHQWHVINPIYWKRLMIRLCQLFFIQFKQKKFNILFCFVTPYNFLIHFLFDTM